SGGYWCHHIAGRTFPPDLAAFFLPFFPALLKCIPTRPDGHFVDVSSLFPRCQCRVSACFACQNRVLSGTRGGGAACLRR
ncbi:hypothetical protein, partial [Photorhabdus heterorhabditis]|uniref:hypothetical protein n=1 Tax=Photorhabdus heterorhabditis TaxID=880156 RepID=UPI001F4329B6